MHYFHQHPEPEPWCPLFLAQGLIPFKDIPFKKLLSGPFNRTILTALAYGSDCLQGGNAAQLQYGFVPSPFFSNKAVGQHSIDTLIEAIQEHPKTNYSIDGSTTKYILTLDARRKLPHKPASAGPFMEVTAIEYIDYYYPPENPKGEGKGDVLNIEVIYTGDGKTVSEVFTYYYIGSGLYAASLEEGNIPLSRAALIMAHELLNIPIRGTINDRKNKNEPIRSREKIKLTPRPGPPAKRRIKRRNDRRFQPPPWEPFDKRFTPKAILRNFSDFYS